MLKIGIIGTGYWGKHHLRVFHQLQCKVIGIADIDPKKEALARGYNVVFFNDFTQLIKKVDAVTIVTPPKTHYKIAKHAIEAGKHVLIEKPFVFNLNEAELLKQKTKEKNLVLMSGHTYLYHPAILKIKEVIEKGEIGKIYYFLFQWLNLGIIRSDVNALWNFAPHPLSILYFLLEELPQSISAVGQAYVQRGIEDVVFLNAKYRNGVIVQINLSWLHPLKIREIVIVGGKKLITFSDSDVKNQLKIHDKGISSEEYKKAVNWNNFAEFKAKGNFGKSEMLKISENEPLKLEFEDFLNSIKQRRRCRSDIDCAIAVLRMLIAANKSIKKGGKWIEV